jgi:hypothetical protein
MKQRKLDPAPFIELAKLEVDVSDVTEVVFENDERGHLLGVQVWFDDQDGSTQEKKESE